MTGTDGRDVTETTREVYELCCEPGAKIKYRSLRLEKIAHCDGHDRWRVTRNGEYIDTINTSAFRSAWQLQQWLDAAADGDLAGSEMFCADCPLRSVPSD